MSLIKVITNAVVDGMQKAKVKIKAAPSATKESFTREFAGEKVASDLSGESISAVKKDEFNNAMRKIEERMVSHPSIKKSVEAGDIAPEEALGEAIGLKALQVKGDIDDDVRRQVMRVEDDAVGLLSRDKVQSAERVFRTLGMEDGSAKRFSQDPELVLSELSERLYKGELDASYNTAKEASTNILSAKEIENITKSGDKLSSIVKLRNAVEAGRKIVDKAASDPAEKAYGKLVTNVFDRSRAFFDLAGDSYRALRDQGFVGTAKGIREFAKRMKTANRFADVTDGLMSRVARISKKKFSDEQQFAIMRYIEQKNPNRMTQTSLGSGRMMIDVDQDLLKSDALFANMGYDEIEFANKINNVFRVMAKKQSQVDAGPVIDFSDISQDFDAYSANIITDDGFLRGGLESYGSHDFGHNHFPAVPTKEHYGRIQAAKDLSGDYSTVSYQHAHNPRMNREVEESALRTTFGNRLNITESLGHYGTGMRKHFVREQGGRLAGDIINTSIIDMTIAKGALRTNVPWEKLKKDVVGSHLYPVFKSFIDATDSVKPYAEYNVVEKALHTYIGAAANGFLNNPATWILNSVQHIMTGATHRSFMSSMVAGTKAKTSFGSKVLTNKGSLSRAYNDMIKNEVDPVAQKVLNRWVNEHPDTSTSFMSELGESGAMWDKLSNNFLFLFRTSDKVSRIGSTYSAIDHAKKAMKTYDVSIRGGSKKSTALAKLSKDLHLATYTEFDRVDILDAINRNDMDEFFYQFTRASIEKENFDYSKLGKPWMVNQARQGSPALGMFLTFRTWNLYAQEILRGAHKAWQAGDREPAYRLFAYSAAFAVAGGYIAKSENETMANIGSGMQSRTPATQIPLGLMSMATDPLSGVLTAPASLAPSLVLKMQNEFVKGMGGDVATGLKFKESDWDRKLNQNVFNWTAGNVSNFIGDIEEAWK